MIFVTRAGSWDDFPDDVPHPVMIAPRPKISVLRINEPFIDDVPSLNVANVHSLLLHGGLNFFRTLCQTIRHNGVDFEQ